MKALRRPARQPSCSLPSNGDAAPVLGERMPATGGEPAKKPMNHGFLGLWF